MAATERVTVLFEPAEKRALQSRAAAAQLSMGEFIKRAVARDDASPTPDQRDELEAVAGQLEEAAQRMAAKLDGVIARVVATLDPAREAEQRRRIEAEVVAMELTGISALFDRAA